MTTEVVKRDNIEKSLLELFERTIKNRSDIPEVKREEALGLITNQVIAPDGITTLNEQVFKDLSMEVAITFLNQFYDEFTKVNKVFTGVPLDVIDERR